MIFRKLGFLGSFGIGIFGGYIHQILNKFLTSNGDALVDADGNYFAVKEE